MGTWHVEKTQLNWERTPPQVPARSAHPRKPNSAQTRLPWAARRRSIAEQAHGTHNTPSWMAPSGIIQSNSWQLHTALVLCRESPSLGAGGVSRAHMDRLSAAREASVAGLRELPGINPGLSLLLCSAWSHPSSRRLESKQRPEVSYTQWGNHFIRLWKTAALQYKKLQE